MNDHWTIYAVGFLAQLLFSGRTLHQWLLSEKKNKVVTPTLFWTLGIIAAFLLLIYGYLRDDFAIIIGQVFMYFIYIRNLQIKGVWTNYPKLVQGLIYLLPVLFFGVVIYIGDINWGKLLSNDDIPTWLIIVGIIGQITFTMRFVYQWLHAEKNKKSTLPMGFWLLSFVGSIIVLFYAIFRKDPVLFIGHLFGLVVYVRNIILLRKNNS